MDGRRALVIDDEVHFRYFLRVLLEKAGFAVKMARNGIEALDVLRSWRPDVITLDVMMPEQSGLTFYGAVCRDETQGPLPAPAACLEKPCTPEALLEVVNRLVPEPTTA